MNWTLSHRYDRQVLPLADRHYNRQKPGTPQFSPPGRLIVLRADSAVWTTVAQEYVKHRWVGAWMNSLFRREGGGLASQLIREACAATRALWGDPPAIGLISFVDASRVRPKRDPGYCYLRAGFEPDGETVGGLLAFRLPGSSFPAPMSPHGAQLDLWGAA